MKITIYELIGMIKDGKAPKKIKIDDNILTLSKVDGIRYRFENCVFLNWDYYIEGDKLDKVIEIIDIEYLANDLGNRLMKPFYDNLEEQKKIPEKLCWKPKESMAGELTQKEQLAIIARRTEKLKKEFNNLLDYLESKGEE